MSSAQVDESSGCFLIGGELLEWSDARSADDAGALMPLLDELLAQQDFASVCLVGPTAAALLDRIPRETPVSVLVRGLDDARRIASQAPLRGVLEVTCGDLGRFSPGIAGDLVVALDPSEILLSPDSRGMSNLAVLDKLRGMVEPGGLLVVLQNNQFSATGLVELDLRFRRDSDKAWFRGSQGFDSRNLYLRELQEWMAGQAENSHLFGAWSSGESPRLLVSESLSEHRDMWSLASVLARRQQADHFSRRAALIDPYTFANEVFESGLALELAPSWVAVIETGKTHLRLSPLLAAEAGRSADWRMEMRAAHVDGGLAWTGRAASGRSEVSERRVARDYAASDRSFIEGQLLETALREACVGIVFRPVRDLLQRYAGWLRDPHVWEGSAEASRPFATPDNVVLSADGQLAVFDPTWRWNGQMDVDVALAGSLRRFASRLLRSGAEHQWRVDISPDELAETFGVMVGLPWSYPRVNDIAVFESEVEAVANGWGAVEESALIKRNMQAGSSQFTAVPGPARGYRESFTLSGEMAQALHERTGQVKWLEVTLRSRDVRVGELEHVVDDVRASVSFKVGRALTYPGRATFKMGRRFVESMLPPGFMNKVERMLRRLAR